MYHIPGYSFPLSSEHLNTELYAASVNSQFSASYLSNGVC